MPKLEWHKDPYYSQSYYAERDGSRFEVYRDNLIGMWTVYAKDDAGNIVSGTEYYPTMALAKDAAENMELTHA